MKMRHIAIATFLVGIFVMKCSGLMCYTCAYTSLLSDNACKGPSIDSSMLIECGAGTNCQVITTTTTNPSSTTIARSCSLGSQVGCVDILQNRVCTETCSSDGCNNGNNGNGGNDGNDGSDGNDGNDGNNGNNDNDGNSGNDGNGASGILTSGLTIIVSIIVAIIMA